MKFRTLKRSLRKHWPTILKNYFTLLLVGSVMMFIVIDTYAGMKVATSYLDVDVKQWLRTPYFACGVNFVGYGDRFAVLRYAHIDVNTRTFSIPCSEDKPEYYFLRDGVKGNIMTVKNLMKENILNDWMNNLTFYTNYQTKKYEMTLSSTPTFVVYRIEAHNLYHATCEWYNIFLVSQLLNFDPRKVEILFTDDRPPNLLDGTWEMLFGKISKYDTIRPDNVYKALIWSIYSYESLLNAPSLQSLPYVTEFRDFILESLTINPNRPLNCNRLKVTVILRRDYASHPELTNHIVYRKFHNDSEVLEIVRSEFQDDDVRGIYLETLTMKEQVEITSQTDILVGMHGAGLSHILFLPKHAGCFEIFPKYAGDFIFFQAFSRWRGTRYIHWKNTDILNEFPQFKTKIPAHVLTSRLSILKQSICEGF